MTIPAWWVWVGVVAFLVLVYVLVRWVSARYFAKVAAVTGRVMWVQLQPVPGSDRAASAAFWRTYEGETLMQITNIPPGMRAVLQLGDFTDQFGKPAQIDKVTGIVASNPDLASVEALTGDQLQLAVTRLNTADEDATLQRVTITIDGRRQAEGTEDLVQPFDIVFQFTTGSEPATAGGISSVTLEPVPTA